MKSMRSGCLLMFRDKTPWGKLMFLGVGEDLETALTSNVVYHSDIQMAENRIDQRTHLTQAREWN